MGKAKVATELCEGSVLATQALLRLGNKDAMPQESGLYQRSLASRSNMMIF